MRTHLQLVALMGRQAWLLTPALAIGLGLCAVMLGQAVVTAEIFTMLFSPDPGDLTTPLVMLVLLVLLRPALALVRELVTVRVMASIKTDLRRRIAEHTVRRGPVAAARGRSGELQSVLVEGVENLEPYYARYIPQLGITMINSIAVVVLLVAVDPVVAAVVGGCAIVLPLIPRLWDKALTARGTEHWDAYARLHSDVVDNIQAMTMLKSLNAQHEQRRRLEDASNGLLAATLGQMRVSLAESGISAVALVGGPVLALAVAAARVGSGALAPAAVFTVALLTFELFRPFKELSAHWHAGYLGVFAGGRVRELLSTPLDPEPETPVESHATAPLRIDLSDVSYRYPDTEHPAVAGLDLHVAAGEQLAVVGRSGSGKSTLASLLSRLVLPSEGTVALDGVATTDLRRTDCVRQVGLVAQTPVLFHGDLRTNLLSAAPRASEAELHRVVVATGLCQLAEDGTASTALTRDIGERGAKLSGGQRQRVALARILLRRPRALILDEATSALDPAAEHDLLAELRRLLPEVTMIIVAHRLSAVRDLGRIVVMDQGRVVEDGDHATLVAHGGLYAHMVAEQQDRLNTDASEVLSTPAIEGALS